MIDRKLLAAGVALAALSATPALAQNATPRSAETQVTDLADVVVTARRREERLLDVPISVTAVGGAQIEARGATNIKDLQYSVPGLSALEYGPGKERIQLRGISNAAGLPTVGRYLDEMSINTDIQESQIDLRLLDMERVEVLRGPQGSLYGEGSMGGTIRYITANPDFTGVSGAMAAEAGQVTDGDTSWRINGHLNLPLVEDRLAVRLVAGYERQGGWVDRPSTGARDINDAEIATVRAKLLGRLSEDTDVTLMVMHQESDQTNQNFGLDRISPLSVATPNTETYDLLSAVLRHDLGFAELVVAGGFIDREAGAISDLSPAYVPFLTAPPPFGFGFPVGFVTEVPLVSSTNEQIVTGEVRLVSNSDGPLSWIVGANLRNDRADTDTDTATSPNVLPFSILSVDTLGKSRSWSVWGEATWAFSDRLEATAGLRYYSDHRSTASTLVSFGVPTISGGSDTFTSTNPNFKLKYEITDTAMVFFSAGKGFRSGGFNSTSVTTPTFAPESLWSYELGTKNSLFDGKLLVEAGVYYNEWTEVQTTFFGANGLGATTNGGDVSGWGTDLALTYRPFQGLQIGGTWGWNDMAYDQVPTDPITGLPSGDKAPGDPTDYNVETSWSAFFDWRRPIADRIDLFVRADFQHGGDALITLRSPAYNQFIHLPERDLLSARIGVEYGRYEVSLYGDNLLDEDAPIIPGPFGVLIEDVEQRPRTVGVAMRARF